MKFLLKYLKKFKLYTFIVIFLFIIRSVLEIFIPFLLGKFINILINQTSKGIISKDIYLTFLYIMLISLFTLIVVIISSFFEARLNTNILYEMRKDLYKKIQSLSKKNIDKLTVSSLITRQTQDLENIFSFIAFNMKMIILQPLFLTGYLVMSFYLSVSLTLHIFILVVFLVSISFFNIYMKRKYNPILRKIEDDINLKTREHVAGIRVIKAFNKEKEQENKQEKNLDDYRLYNLRLNRIETFFSQVFVFFQGAVIVFLTYLAVKQNYLSLDFKPGDLFTLTQYGGRILFAFIFFIMTANRIPEINVRIKRVNEVFETKNELIYSNEKNNIDINKIDATIKFENVSYIVKDAEKPILKNINFEIKQGQTLAIIGLIGSGKTTILNLIKRYFDPTSGTITIGNINIKDIDKQKLNYLISIAPQSSGLFKGTVKENVCFSNSNLNEDEIVDILKKAEAYDFVFKKENKLNHIINQAGSNLSGGQKQRLSIARLLASNSKVLLFDDSFSALDNITDKKIRNNIKTLNKTKIIVAQRINTIIDADKILVLKSGEQVGYGTHEELIKNCPLYKEIAISQNFIKEDMYEKS